MSELIKKLSPNTEFMLIISLSFGYSILISVLVLFGYSFDMSFTNATLISSIFFELIILFAVVLFLNIRGTEIDYRNNTNMFKLILAGITIFIVYYFVYYIIYFIMSGFFTISDLSNNFSNSGNHPLNFFVILSFSIVNAVFEEFIVVGYVIPVLSSRKSILLAINVSVLIRFLYHLYQGPMAAISIIPLGLLFAFVYVKWKNIWMIIIAHALMDLLALSYYGL